MSRDVYPFDSRPVPGLGDFGEDEEWIEFDDYQRAAQRTAQYPKEMGLYYAALELASEAGEVAGKAKKIMRDNGGVLSAESIHAITLELGDALWGCAAVATEIGIPLSRAARLNLEKLASRAARGKIIGDGDTR